MSPQQLLSQSTDIHYAERPDLNKLLVCGQRKMRQEVARICRYSW
ncbi:unnamed protein product [Arabidopsis lyrata]|nr:unnamed protein product [Arabidopsis lyrata]